MTYTSIYDEDEGLMLHRVVDWQLLETMFDRGEFVRSHQFWHEVRTQFEAAGLDYAVMNDNRYGVKMGLFPEYREALERIAPVAKLEVGVTCIRNHKIESEGDLIRSADRVRCRSCRREDGQKRNGVKRANRLTGQQGNELKEAA